MPRDTPGFSVFSLIVFQILSDLHNELSPTAPLLIIAGYHCKDLHDETLGNSFVKFASPLISCPSEFEFLKDCSAISTTAELF